MLGHAIALAIALEAFQIGAVIRVVMEDRGAAIPTSEDVIEPAGAIEACLDGHWGERGGWSYNESIRIPDANHARDTCVTAFCIRLKPDPSTTSDLYWMHLD